MPVNSKSRKKRLPTLKKRLEEWDGKEVTSSELLCYLKKNSPPLWLRFGNEKRLIAYLRILKRQGYLQNRINSNGARIWSKKQSSVQNV